MILIFFDFLRVMSVLERRLRISVDIYESMLRLKNVRAQVFEAKSMMNLSGGFYVSFFFVKN